MRLNRLKPALLLLSCSLLFGCQDFLAKPVGAFAPKPPSRPQLAEPPVAQATDSVAAQADTGQDTSAAETGEPLPEVQDLIPPLLAKPERAPFTEDLNWSPDLSDPRALIDQRLTDTQSLDEKITTLMTLAYLVDAELYIRFRDLIDRLDATGRDVEMERQRTWLEQRKTSLTQAFLEFEDEKAARYNAAQAFLRESNKRMREIEQSLSAVN